MGNAEFECTLEHREWKGLGNKANVVVVLVNTVNEAGLAYS